MDEDERNASGDRGIIASCCIRWRLWIRPVVFVVRRFEWFSFIKVFLVASELFSVPIQVYFIVILILLPLLILGNSSLSSTTGAGHKSFQHNVLMFFLTRPGKEWTLYSERSMDCWRPFRCSGCAHLPLGHYTPPCAFHKAPYAKIYHTVKFLNVPWKFSFWPHYLSILLFVFLGYCGWFQFMP